MVKVERVMIKPNIRMYGGVKVTKDMEFSESNKDKTVMQTLKNLKLTTTMNKKYGDEYKTVEKSTLTQELPEGIILVWDEQTGFIIPNNQVCYIQEGIDTIVELQEIVNSLGEEKE